MGRTGKIAVSALIAVLVLLIAGITFTIGWRPFLGPKARAVTNRTFESTPARLERGRYLVQGVGTCMDCHAPHDWTKHDAPVLPGMLGAGQDMSSMKGLPGPVVAPNLTPDMETGAGSWTDDQLARAIREGIGHDGRTLFPMMPYTAFSHFSDEDLASIVVYLRSLKPVRNALPKTAIDFPVNRLINTVPQPITASVPAPDVSSPVKLGNYLATVAGCSECHTPQAKGQPIRGLEFGGGLVLEGPWGRVTSANITPDPSGIPYYDEALFVQVLRTGYVKARELNQIMPWPDYRNLTDEDLKAIFAYLKTLPPVKHRVDNQTAPTNCRLCQSSHGLGDQN